MKAQKNDDRDAEAIAEAATRPTIRFVELKSAEQLDLQSLHRVRDRLVGERTALMNQLRAVLMERGITVPQGRRKLEQHLSVILDGEELRLSPRARSLIEDMRAEWEALDRRVEAFDDEFAAQARTDDAARGLASIPGIGVLRSPSAVAYRRSCICRGTRPSQAGEVARHGGSATRQQIADSCRQSRRVRAALPSLSASTTPLGNWLKNLLQRAHKNTVIVALANKLARIVWAVLRHGGTYDAAAMKAA